MNTVMTAQRALASTAQAASISAMRGATPAARRSWIVRTGRRVAVAALGLGAIAALVIVGGLELLTVRVPSLPAPQGPYQVGSEVFRWTDARRPEILTAETDDRRQVVAQAWYPADAAPGRTTAQWPAAGAPVPYFEAQGQLPAYLDPYPSFVFRSFNQVDTHAGASTPASTARPTWPVLVFLPGWGAPREHYTALCADLASRGFVVVALSHPYESAISLLADGHVVGPVNSATMFGGSMEDMVAIRAADSSFVLDQLSRLDQVAPGSPLLGHLDLQHVGVVGHSLGGATAVQVVANDARILAGVNIDGVITDRLAGLELTRPFLWLQADGTPGEHYRQVRDQLMGGLRDRGEVLVVGGSGHSSFTDLSTYVSPVGRRLLGDDGVAPAVNGSGSGERITSETGDVIAAFVGLPLGTAEGASLDQALARHPSIRRQSAVGAAS
jgi:predicted dienelactone hydrolase